MKHFNKKAVLGFLLAAFLCAQGTGLAPAAEEAGELVSERTEEPELPEKGGGAAEEFVQECTEKIDSEEEGITEEATEEEEEADAGKRQRQTAPGPGRPRFVAAGSENL